MKTIDNPEKCKRYDCPSRLNCVQHPEAREQVGCPFDNEKVQR